MFFIIKKRVVSGRVGFGLEPLAHDPGRVMGRVGSCDFLKCLVPGSILH